MTTATQEQETTENAATDQPVELSAEQSRAVNYLANKFLNNVQLSEALSVISLNQLLQLVQQQVIKQATKDVQTMQEEQLAGILEEAQEFEKNLSQQV